MHVLDRARAVINAEAEAVRLLADRLDARFTEAVDTLLHCRGRIVVTGVGKAGAIARKVAATLASTGTPSLYLHPAEGVHGDLGVVTADDVVIALSYSGESDEIIRLLPTIRRIGPRLIALAGNETSTLARAADIVLDTSVSAEACPLNLAPSASTAAMLAMGDALALATMEARGFTREDFAGFHPAGALGRRLTLRASDVMRSGEQLAVAPASTRLIDVMFLISKAGAGMAFLVDDSGVLAGIVTDGDIRRAIVHDTGALDRPTSEVMNRNPLLVTGDPLAAEALNILEESPRPGSKGATGEAPVVDSDGRPVGLIMLKDLVRAGIV